MMLHRQHEGSSQFVLFSCRRRGAVYVHVLVYCVRGMCSTLTILLLLFVRYSTTGERTVCCEKFRCFLLRQGNSEDYCTLCSAWLFIAYPLPTKVFFCRFCTGHLIESYGFLSFKKNVVLVMNKCGTLVELALENRSPRRKTSPSATFPPEIPHGLNRDLTWASVVRGRRLTA
jgi:hypothetical protein